MSDVDSFVIAVPTVNKPAYQVAAEKAAAGFSDHGATRIVEGWGDDVPAGKVTSFPMAVQCKDDETVVFSWIEWPSKQARDAGMKAAMADPRMPSGSFDMPFDGQRMIFGGFAPMLDQRNG